MTVLDAVHHALDEVNAEPALPALVEQMVTPLPGVKTVEISSTGTGAGAASADAVALIGYLAGRLALGAPELLQ